MNLKKLIQNHLQLIYITSLTLIFAGVYYYCFDTKIFLGGDNVYYYNLGKALAEGKGYVTLNLPKMPLASHYPPGYPGIIALIMVIASQSIMVIKVVNGIFLLASSIVCFFFFKEITEDVHLSFVGALLLIINPLALEYGYVMMSEIPFLFFSVLTFLTFTKIKNDESPIRQIQFYIFILCLGITYHIKTLGIALLAGFIFYLLILRNWKLLASILTGFIILSLPWGVREYLVGGGSYINQFLMVNPYRPELGQASLSDFLIRFVSNVQQYIAVEVPFALFPFLKNIYPAPSLISWILGITICLFILFGITQLKNYSFLIGSYFLGFFGIILLWPNIWTDVRFLVPVLPMLIFFFLVGTYYLGFLALKQIDYSRLLHPLYLLIFAIYFIPSLEKLHHESQAPYPVNWGNYIKMAEWAKENTHPNVVISCRKPAIFNLFSDRKTFRYKDTTNPEVLLNDLKSHQTNYVVVDKLGFSSTPRYLVPALNKYKDQFKVILRSNRLKSYLLRLKTDYSK